MGAFGGGLLLHCLVDPAVAAFVVVRPMRGRRNEVINFVLVDLTSFVIVAYPVWGTVHLISKVGFGVAEMSIEQFIAICEEIACRAKR